MRSATDALITVCKQFDEIAGTRSRRKKERLLRELKADDGLNIIVRTLYQKALDPGLLYGIRNLSSTKTTITRAGSATWETFIGHMQRLEKEPRSERMRQETELLLDCMPAGTREWLRRVILKDLRMGVSTSTANKVWPGLIEEFLVQLCADVVKEELSDLPFPVVVEPKLDGVRCLVVVSPTGIKYLSRYGSKLYNTEKLDRECIQNAERYVLDGEVMAGTFHETMAVVRSSVSKPPAHLLKKLKLYVFDAMPLAEWDLRNCTRNYSERRSFLNERFPLMTAWEDRTGKASVVEVMSKICTTVEEVEKESEYWLQAGLEGVVIKKKFGAYDFARTSAWLRYKPFESGDFQILGAYEGKGKHVGRLGGFVVDAGRGITCNVGGGFSDKQRTAFWEAEDHHIGDVAEVKYKMRTPDGRLREPVFRRLRPDKD